MKHSNEKIAYILDHAAATATPTAQITLSQSLTLAEAYDVQRRSIEQRHSRGECITGYKLGFTSRAKMEQMGVHDIIWGRLTDQMIIKSQGKMLRADKIHPRVEPEIAFRIAKRIDREISLSEAMEYIDGITCALEVIDSRYENFKFSLEDVIADNCSSTGYLLGAWLPSDTSVRDLPITMLINQEVVQKGSSDAILGNPLESLVEASKMMEKYNAVIEPGHVVLAGAATSAVHIHAGDHVVGLFADWDPISFKII